MKNYRPLPTSLTIRASDIEGLGLFATEDIPKGTNLGRSHIKVYAEVVRTPLGGFYNHSEDPNVVKKPVGNTKWNLVTKRDIKAGEEITVKYTFYKLDNDIIIDKNE
jgi:SET domain-containing protein